MTQVERWHDKADQHERKAKELRKFGLEKEAKEHEEKASWCRENARRWLQRK